MKYFTMPSHSEDRVYHATEEKAQAAAAESSRYLKDDVDVVRYADATTLGTYRRGIRIDTHVDRTRFQSTPEGDNQSVS